jgi:hypothetical protein
MRKSWKIEPDFNLFYMFLERQEFMMDVLSNHY